MDNTAIQAIGQLAIEAEKANRLDTDTPAILLQLSNGAQDIISLEPYQPGRSRYRGKFVSRSLDAFAGYVLQQAEQRAGMLAAQAQGFIEPERMQARVYLNLGDHEHPGHGDHTATLALAPTAAYDALRNICANPRLTQRAVHDFVEDWRDHITVLIDGEPRENGVPAALAAIRDISIEQARKVQHVERDFGATRNAMESVDAKSALVLPSGFLFRCLPYDGLAEREFRLRLGVNTGDDKLSLNLRLQQAEQVREAIAADFHARLEAKLGTSSTLLLGEFTP